MSGLEEKVAPGRAALLTMEVQRGVVGDLASMRALADRLAEQDIPKRLGGLLRGARAAGIPVIHCRAAFRPDRRGSFRNVPMVNQLLKNPDHLVLGSPEAEVIPELGPEPEDLDSVRLHGMSPFYGTDLDPMLRSLGVSTVIATGVSLNVGILGLVIEALNRGHEVVLVKDCVTGYPAEYAERVLEHSLARITTQTTAEALLELWR
ncbi:MAG: cysteine hydrolase family protein [bacterium]